jgi:hypothetical protein
VTQHVRVNQWQAALLTDATSIRRKPINAHRHAAAVVSS